MPINATSNFAAQQSIEQKELEASIIHILAKMERELRLNNRRPLQSRALHCPDRLYPAVGSSTCRLAAVTACRLVVDGDWQIHSFAR